MTTLLDLGKGFRLNNPNQTNGVTFGQTSSDTFIRYGTVTNILEDGRTAVITLDGNSEEQTIEVQVDTYFEIGYRVQVAYKDGQILAQVAGKQDIDFTYDDSGGSSGGGGFDPSDINSRLDDLESWKTTTDAWISSMGSWKSTVDSDLTSYGTKIEQLTNNYNTLSTTVSGLGTNMSGLQNSVGNLITRVTNLENAGSGAPGVTHLYPSNGRTISGFTTFGSTTTVPLYNHRDRNWSGTPTFDSYYGVYPGSTGYFLAWGSINIQATNYSASNQQFSYGLSSANNVTTSYKQLNNINLDTTQNTMYYYLCLSGTIPASSMYLHLSFGPVIIYIPSSSYRLYFHCRSSTSFWINPMGTELCLLKL